MSEYEHETHEDIMEFARRELEGHERINCWFRPEFVRALIDRLEAAHKREVDELKEQIEDLRQQRDIWFKRADELKTKCDEQYAKLKVCNAAKLYEAVGYILKYADSAACRDHDEHTRHYIDQIRKWAQSALAAPPRNCDRFKTKEEAATAFANEKKQWIPQQVLWELAPWLDWLFVTIEKEGGEA